MFAVNSGGPQAKKISRYGVCKNRAFFFVQPEARFRGKVLIQPAARGELGKRREIEKRRKVSDFL
jgi:hypothetical protein